MANKKSKGKKKSPAKSSRIQKLKTKAAVKNKPPKKKKVALKAKAKPAPRKPRGRANAGELVSYEPRGLGARSGGQSGDTQGIAAKPDVDSESVEELLEEGQSYEAEVVEGVENAPDPDQGEVRTREVEEDDVPEEYRGKDN
ncbi:MAG TPA: hypothetical protein VK703_13135 [Candidatus Acidoferrales bacterium]|jgi:hypothetical protein|nr:hypothetical protein [Candidatus Acidoferrales bacterium]